MTTAENEPDSERSKNQFSSLLATLNEAEQTIRSYDTKAQIMGVGFIFSLTMISNLLENLPVDREYGFIYLIAGFILLVGPVVLFGSVLYPTRRTAPKTMSEHSPVHHCLYFRSDSGKGLDDYIQDINAADWQTELAYEIIRLSGLRDLKRKRFLMAMFAAGASFALILLGNALKLGGVT